MVKAVECLVVPSADFIERSFEVGARLVGAEVGVHNRLDFLTSRVEEELSLLSVHCDA